MKQSRSQRAGMTATMHEFLWLWNTVQQHWSTPPFHHRIARFLVEGLTTPARSSVLLVFRGGGKSTLTGLFAAWLLYRNPDHRILITAAEQELANKMVGHIRAIIEHHPLTQSLKPAARNNGPWRADALTITRPTIHRDPSVLARGIGANITGARADIIICDDVAVPNTTHNLNRRSWLDDRLADLLFVLTPKGRMFVLETPFDHASAHLEHDQSSSTSPPLRRVLKIPVQDEQGQSVWPERFSQEDLKQLRHQQGDQRFAEQMLLQFHRHHHTSLFNPADLQTFNERVRIPSSPHEPLELGTHRLIQAAAFWDPALGRQNGDKSILAIAYADTDHAIWITDVHDIGALDQPPHLTSADPPHSKNPQTHPTAQQQCQRVATVLKTACIPIVSVEINGVGGFLPDILRTHLQTERWVIPVRSIHQRKSKAERIRSALLPLFRGAPVGVHTHVASGHLGDELRHYNGRSRNADDTLDAVAGVLSEPMATIRRHPRPLRFRQFPRFPRRQFSSSSF